jgi:hypothetical protein
VWERIHSNVAAHSSEIMNMNKVGKGLLILTLGYATAFMVYRLDGYLRARFANQRVACKDRAGN